MFFSLVDVFSGNRILWKTSTFQFSEKHPLSGFLENHCFLCFWVSFGPRSLGESGKRGSQYGARTSEKQWKQVVGRAGWYPGRHPTDHGCRVGKGDYLPVPPTTLHPQVQCRLCHRVHRCLPAARRCSPGFFRLGALTHVDELRMDPRIGVCQNRRFCKNVHVGIWRIAIGASSVKTSVFQCFLLFSGVLAYSSHSF